MNHSELIDRLTSQVKIKKKDVNDVLMALVGTILTEAMATGKCRINGLGTFKVKERKARSATIGGRDVDVPARRAMTFNPSQNVRDTINS